MVERARPLAKAVAVSLSALTQTTPILITWDNLTAARQLAAEVGIPGVTAGLLPAEKAGQVRDIQAAGARVLLIGDGVNDAPALAAAVSVSRRAAVAQTLRWRPRMRSSSATTWPPCPPSSRCPGGRAGSS